jgi:hypothetical protein
MRRSGEGIHGINVKLWAMADLGNALFTNAKAMESHNDFSIKVCQGLAEIMSLVDCSRVG